MVDDKDEAVKARLAQLKAPNERRSNVRTYALCASALALGVGLGAYAMMPRGGEIVSPETLSTSSVTEFQTGDGLDGFTITKAKEPGDLQLTAKPDEDIDGALQARLDAMEADSKAALAAVQKQVEDERAAGAERDKALAEAEAERARLEGELLNASQLAPDTASADAEAQRLADLEHRRQQAEDQRKAQIASPMIAFRAGSQADSSTKAVPVIDPVTGAIIAGDGAKPSDFLRAGASKSKATRAEIIANPGNTVVQGTMIEATLETSVDTSLPGNVVANVSQDVWSMDMSQILIPKGAKLYGRYNSDIEQGQKRVMIAWDRLIRADGMTVELEGYGSDRMGRSGLTGKVDNHTLSKFGAAAAVLVIGALPGVLEAAASNDSKSGDRNVVGGIYGNIGQGASSALSGVAGGYLNREPTITLNQGQVVLVRLNTDLELF